MKETDNGGWCHLACATWIRGIHIDAQDGSGIVIRQAPGGSVGHKPARLFGQTDGVGGY